MSGQANNRLNVRWRNVIDTAIYLLCFIPLGLMFNVAIWDVGRASFHGLASPRTGRLSDLHEDVGGNAHVVINGFRPRTFQTLGYAVDTQTDGVTWNAVYVPLVPENQPALPPADVRIVARFDEVKTIADLETVLAEGQLQGSLAAPRVRFPKKDQTFRIGGETELIAQIHPQLQPDKCWLLEVGAAPLPISEFCIPPLVGVMLWGLAAAIFCWRLRVPETSRGLRTWNGIAVLSLIAGVPFCWRVNWPSALANTLLPVLALTVIQVALAFAIVGTAFYYWQLARTTRRESIIERLEPYRRSIRQT